MPPGAEEAEVLLFQHDRIGARQRRGAGQGVLQLTDVAWPCMCPKASPSSIRYAEVGPPKIREHAVNELWKICQPVA
jgi:hypothetical protein